MSNPREASDGERLADYAPTPLAGMNEEEKREYWATLALRHCAGLGARSRAKLLKIYKKATRALENYKNWTAKGIPQASVNCVAAEKWRVLARKEWDEASRSGASILLWSNSLYPIRLRELRDAPILLYCVGDVTLLKSPCVAIVGSRDASPESLRIAESLAQTLACAGITVASGMAAGIDKAAHRGALTGIGSSIGVLGAGVQKQYPPSNKSLYAKMNERGLLISEFSPQTPPSPYNFPIRNRIISGLSLGVIVVEAAAKSGSLITAKLALEQNREVFAVPGPAFSERSVGCKNLLRQGARPVFGAEDVLRDLSGELKSFKAPERLNGPIPATPENPSSVIHEFSNPPADPAADEAARNLIAMDADTLLDVLKTNGSMTADELAIRLNAPVSELAARLLGLEMLALIRRLPGGRYELL